MNVSVPQDNSNFFSSFKRKISGDKPKNVHISGFHTDAFQIYCSNFAYSWCVCTVGAIVAYAVKCGTKLLCSTIEPCRELQNTV